MQKQVLIVEDNELARTLIEGQLYQTFELFFCTDGEQAIKAFKNGLSPDVVITDIVMPKVDGLELCRYIRKQKEFESIPIIILSVTSTIEEMVKGYEAGADEFLVKPVDSALLQNKIKRLLSLSKTNYQYQKKFADAKSEAADAIVNASDLSKAMQTIDKLSESNTQQDIATLLNDFCHYLNLKSTVRVIVSDQPFILAQDNSCNTIEYKIIEKLSSRGPLYEHEDRVQFNAAGVSVFIKNFPIENPEKCQRYRDLFPFVLKSASNRLQAIGLENELQRDVIQLQNNVTSLADAMDKLMLAFARQKELGSTAVENLTNIITSNKEDLSLTSMQVDLLIELLEAEVNQSLYPSESMDSITDHFNQTIKALMAMVIRQQKVVNSSVRQR